MAISAAGNGKYTSYFTLQVPSLHATSLVVLQLLYLILKESMRLGSSKKAMYSYRRWA